MLRLSDIAAPAARVLWEESLGNVIRLMVGERGEGPYRVIVTSKAGVVRGVVTGRVVLEVLAGWRASALRERLGFKALLNEPIHVFANEALHIFPHWMRVAPALKYMLENRVGYIIVVDDLNRLIGAVEDKNLLPLIRGVNVNVRASEAMESDLHVIKPDNTVLSAVKLMVQTMKRRLPVVGNGGRVEGIVTASDVLREAIGSAGSIEEVMNRPVSEVMESNVIHVDPEAGLDEVIDALIGNDVSSVLVIDKDLRLKGMITRLDALIAATNSLGVNRLVEVMVERAGLKIEVVAGKGGAG